MENKICRTCFSFTDLKNIFGLCDISNNLLSDMLMECCSIKVYFSDVLPKKICINCIKVLHICYSFRKKCLETQQLFEILEKNQLFNENFFQIEEINRQTLLEKIQKIKNDCNNDSFESNPKSPEDFVSIKVESDLDTCEKDDNFFKILKNSQIQNEDKVKYKCTKCESIFESKVKFKNHLNKHKKFQCPHCPKYYIGRKDSLNYHLRANHSLEKPQFPCSRCNKKFTTHVSVKRHLLTVHEKTCVYKCDKCNKNFTRKTGLNYHLTKYHNNSSRSSTNSISLMDKSEKVKPLKCRNYGKGKELDVSAILRINRYQCNKCEQKFFNQFFYENHLKEHENQNLQKFPCCQLEFLNEKAYKRHRAKTHGENFGTAKDLTKNLCNICGKSFSTIYHLRDHINKHTDERPYSCLHCPKKFTSSTNLRNHVVFHSGYRGYKCSICEKAFYQQSHLTTHMKEHTGERPFECEICHRRFKEKVNRDGHVRMHKGEKPFECKLCQDAFYDSGRLSKHIKKIHPSFAPQTRRVEKIDVNISS